MSVTGGFPHKQNCEGFPSADGPRESIHSCRTVRARSPGPFFSFPRAQAPSSKPIPCPAALPCIHVKPNDVRARSRRRDASSFDPIVLVVEGSG